MDRDLSFGEAPEEEEFHLTEYLRVISKHRWIVVGCVLCVVGLAGWYAFTTVPIYEASATLVIEKDQPLSPLADDSIGMGSLASQAVTIKTHANLISTRPVIERVIRSLNLEEVDRLGALDVHSIRRLFRTYVDNFRMLAGWEISAPVAPDPDRRKLALIQKIRSKIDVTEVRDTRLLRISVEDQSPETARDIANTLVDSYIRFNMENRNESSRDNLRWLTSQLYDVQKKLEDAEADFIRFKKSQQIFSVSGRQEVINQKIGEINSRYLETRNDRLELRAKLDKLAGVRSGRRVDILRVRSLVPNPLIDDLYTQLVEAELEQGRLAKVYREKHPKMEQIESRIGDIRTKLGSEISKELESMRARHDILADREQKLQAVLADFEKEALDTNQQELEFTIFQRNLDTNQKLYDALLSKVKEADLTEKIDTSNIRLTEAAVAPVAPVRPKKVRNLALGLFLGLVLGVGMAFLREYMDQSLGDEEAIQRYLGLPVLSVIPEADRT